MSARREPLESLDADVKDPARAEYGDDPMAREATELMLAAQGGDRGAFDRLVERHRGRAFRVASALVGSHDDAMELTQEAFLKVYRSRASFRAGEPFLPWFHRILRNTCFSFLRGKGRLKARSVSAHADGADDDEADYEIADASHAPGDGLLADERKTAFWSAFETLSARDREILALRHFQEQSYREIAHALSIPEGTVMSRLFHARRRLRESLGPAFADEIGDAGGGEGDDG